MADTIPHKDYEETTDNLVKLLEAATNQAREHQLMRKREKYIPNCSRQSSRGPAAHHDENIQRQDRINRGLDFYT